MISDMHDRIKIATYNARKLRNVEKRSKVMNLLDEEEIDIVVITEIWDVPQW